jgi:hypothetical protein
MSGFSPANPEPMGALRAFHSGMPVMNRSSRVQLIAGLLCAGSVLGLDSR